jgi:uncharacterized protein (DUF2141 family)
VEDLLPGSFDEEEGVITQTGATWGIDRIDQRDLPMNQSYVYRADGAGVNVYIIDSGIRFSHIDFEGRAANAVDLVPNEEARNGLDCTGHGSHVAGTVGGRTFGVAKKVSLQSVRIFGCPDPATGQATSPRSRTVAAVNWVTANYDRSKPTVVNMSVGGNNEGFPGLSSLDMAVEAGVAAGITFAVSAGNDNGLNACQKSPARAPNAITVGSTTTTDTRSGFSNVGSCVDIFAPGSSITSAHWTSDNGTRTISGTSMAAPHVAGVAALYLGLHPSATPAQVTTALVSTATPGKVVNAGTNSPNLLLYSVAPSNSAPVARITALGTVLEGTTVAFSGAASSDADDDMLTYQWTFAPGNTADGVTASWLYPDNGTFTTTLRVSDIFGAAMTASHTVVVQNVAPTVTSFGLNATTILSGQSVTATASFTDPGALDAPWTHAVSWGDTRTSNGSTSTQGTAIVASQQYLKAGTYVVGVTVTDKDGGSGTGTANLTVNRVGIEIDVRPGSNDNPISWSQPQSAKIPTAILGSASLNVRDIVVGSVVMGDFRVATKKSGAAMASYEDVNGDGRMDLVLHFERGTMAAEGSLLTSTTTLELLADLTSGVQVRGSDRVRVLR